MFPVNISMMHRYGRVALSFLLLAVSPLFAQPAQTPYGVVMLTAKSEIVDLDLSIDGSRIVTTDKDGRVYLWETVTGKLVRGLVDKALSARFSPVDMRVVTAHDKYAETWDGLNGSLYLAFTGHAAGMRSATFSPNGLALATGGSDGTVYIWEAGKGQRLQTMSNPGAGITSMQFSGDAHTLLTCGTDLRLRAWKATTGEMIRAFPTPTNFPEAMALRRDGSQSVSASGADALVWNTGDSIPLHRLSGHSGTIRALALDRSGTLLATAAADGEVRIWNMETGALLHTLSGHIGGAESAIFSEDGSLLVSTGADRIARVWNVSSGELLYMLSGHTDRITRAAISLDGSYVVTASRDHTARIWFLSDHP
jgi:WD40 repeat protein